MEHKRPTLDTVLNWQADDVVHAFATALGVTFEAAVAIFLEFKAMMWLMNEMDFDGEGERGNSFVIDDSLVILDEIWHTFILHTNDYHHFCKQLLGHYVHHAPTTPTQRAQHRETLLGLTREEALTKFRNEKRWQYTYTLKKLGRDRFKLWYEEYHQKYPMHAIMKAKYEQTNPEEG